MAVEQMVERSHRAVLGWANHLCLFQVIPASATKRLSKWLCREQKVRMGKSVRNPDEHLRQDMGLTRPEGRM